MIGIGVDAVDIERFRTSLARTPTMRERLFVPAELAYVATQSELFQSYANLYKAMGGGWIDEAERLVGRADAVNNE